MSAKRPVEPSTPQSDTNKRRSNESMMATEKPTDKLNIPYLEELEIAWRSVNTHPVFQGLPKLQTPPIDIQGFDVNKFKTDVDTYGQYTCGGNMFWADLLYTGTFGVPIIRRGALSQSSLDERSW
jgi:hypothetical protein